MKNVDSAECVERLRQIGIVELPHRTLRFANGPNELVRIPYPRRALDLSSIAETVAPIDEVNDGAYQGSLFWVTDYGIWNDVDEALGQDMIARLRNAGEGPVTLDERPATIYSAHELVAQQGAILIALAIQWDAYCVPFKKDYFIYISHDEYINVVCRTEAAKAFWMDKAGWWYEVLDRRAKADKNS